MNINFDNFNYYKELVRSKCDGTNIHKINNYLGSLDLLIQIKYKKNFNTCDSCKKKDKNCGDMHCNMLFSILTEIKKITGISGNFINC